MKLITRNQIRRLTEEPNHVCLSLYMPLYSTAMDERHQNPVRFKNLMREAQRKLRDWAVPDGNIEAMLSKIQDPDWSDITANERRGFAIFTSASSTRMFTLPYEIPEYTFVHRRFYLRPLLPFLSNNSVFYILSLSRNHMRLYEATQYSIHSMELRGIPENISETEPLHDGRAGHTAYRAVSHEGKVAVIHQAGGVLDDTRIDFDAYLQILNTEVMSHLENDSAPLILVGDESAVGAYKKVNAYPNLLDSSVTVDPETLTPKEVHQRALHAATLCLQKDRNRAFEAYMDLAGTGRTSADLTEILKAADASRISDLFLKLQTQCWGIFEHSSQSAVLQTPDTPMADDLLDYAAFLTLQRNGQVWASLEEQTPNNSEICAVYRF